MVSWSAGLVLNALNFNQMKTTILFVDKDSQKTIRTECDNTLDVMGLLLVVHDNNVLRSQNKRLGKQNGAPLTNTITRRKIAAIQP